MDIRLARPGDAEALRAIYNTEVSGSTVTFDIVPRSHADQVAWIERHQGVHPAVVAVEEGIVAGFGSLSPFRDRPAYATTVEDSVYVAGHRRGEGVGRLLLDELVSLATRQGFHTVIARTVGDNEPSIACCTGRADSPSSVSNVRWSGSSAAGSTSPSSSGCSDGPGLGSGPEILQLGALRHRAALLVATPAAPRHAVRQKIAIQAGLSSDHARKINKFIKDHGAKGVSSRPRVTSSGCRARSDDLQDVIKALKGEDFGIPLQFTNFRD